MREGNYKLAGSLKQKADAIQHPELLSHSQVVENGPPFDYAIILKGARSDITEHGHRNTQPTCRWNPFGVDHCQ